ncbi:MAG: Phosphoribosylaminoimidazole-succinocarboxamide synthase [Alphaproteobacteria bacterium ADurb.Bin438]|nr:MAG: Phosphoribosylaminoimidazole-succinocarboxamide synthase [Alphaproteobacteria bacterium ADurb.Bin438]
MISNKNSLIFDGRSKSLYESDDKDTYVLSFKDSVESSSCGKKGEIKNKGKFNNYISEFLMMHLSEIGIPNHLIKRIDGTNQLVQKTEVFPLKFIIRNHASGLMVEKLKIPEGTILPRSIIEYVYKNKGLNFPQVSEEHITAFSWAKTRELDEIVSMLLRINDFLTGLFLGIGIRMIDCSLEFGKLKIGDETSIILVDELSPDNIRLIDIKSNNRLDKDRFRLNLENQEIGYYEVAKRLGLNVK